MYMEQAKILYVRKKKVKRNNIINNAKIMKKMFNFDYITKENIKEHNSKYAEIPDRPSRILII